MLFDVHTLPLTLTDGFLPLQLLEKPPAIMALSAYLFADIHHSLCRAGRATQALRYDFQSSEQSAIPSLISKGDARNLDGLIWTRMKNRFRWVETASTKQSRPCVLVIQLLAARQYG